MQGRSCNILGAEFFGRVANENSRKLQIRLYNILVIINKIKNMLL